MLLYETKTPYNGKVQVTEEKGYTSILNQFKSRFPSYQTSVRTDKKYISRFKFYPASLTLGLGYINNPKNVLLIGVAGGHMINYLNHFVPNINLTSIEIDQEMIEIATKYFGVKSDIICSCGYNYLLEHQDDSIDVLMLDAFQSMNIPEVFTTDEFFQVIKRPLKNGVLSVNVVKSSNSESFVNKIQENFIYTDLFYNKGNLTVVAYNSKVDSINNLKAMQSKYKFVYDLPGLSRYRVKSYKDAFQTRKKQSLFSKKDS